MSSSSDTKEHKVFVEYLRKAAPNRMWTEQYFDLIRHLLEIIELKDGDPRLSMTTPRGNSSVFFLPVIVNRGYVLAGYYHKDNEVQYIRYGNVSHPSVFVLCNVEDWANMEEKDKEKVVHVRELGYGGEHKLLQIHLDDITSVPTFQEIWMRNVLSERDSQMKSQHRTSHKPLFYKAVVDLDYRAEVFNEVWPLSEAYLGLRSALDQFVTCENWQSGLVLDNLLDLNGRLLAGMQSVQNVIAARYIGTNNETQTSEEPVAEDVAE